MAVIKVVPVGYQLDGQQYEGQLVFQEGSQPSRALLMAPNFLGVSQGAIDQAEALVDDRSVILVLDPYGKDRSISGPDQAYATMVEVKSDHGRWRRLMVAAYEALLAEAQTFGIAKDNVAAFGFCFGGACVLELARLGIPLKAVVTFHGILDTPDPASSQNRCGPILICNGADDPLVPAESIKAFADEMNAIGADWQLVNFGGTVHSFTDKSANRPGQSQYNPLVTRRAFAMMADLFDEVFA
ncbi:dienelactone hydrolase family protein [Gallaecimonas xiamenensis]|uniref:Dienelactone hydrolase n=1 Tax=Gallaecimonas xiamenensis 3-C-1 TaxID=745411 RepID=K2IYZ0_9GAMM|nr:dienelactone hydrolase family protein [Gallaecimonas xiamenensis]EKE67762.1 dienelactone hydrolase [Gallaecimonas xiamenensis 3-C-1]